MAEHPLKGKFDERRAEWQHAEGSAVEIAFVDDLIGMRNGEDPNSPILLFNQAEWDAFMAGAKDGEFDPETFEDGPDVRD